MINDKAELRIQKEIEKFKNKSYRASAWISTIFIGIYGFFINVLFAIAQVRLLEIILYVLFFLIIVGLNTWPIIQDKDYKALRNFNIISVVFMYSFIIYLLFNNNLPGIYANVFLAFTIGYIFLDDYVATLNHIFMALISSIFVWAFPEIFGFTEYSFYTLILINSSIFILITLLYFSSLFNIRKKNYNYKQLALSKENEYRVINTLFSMSEKYFNENSVNDEYYKSIKSFFEAFSKKHNITNHFTKRINFIEDLEMHDDLSQLDSNFPEEYIQTLDVLAIKKRKRLRLIAFKVSQSLNLDEEKRVPGIDLFSSLRHYDDHEEIKIIAFSAFYVYFRMNKLEKQAIDDDHFISLLKNSDIENLIEPKNLEIYYKHKDVFNKIIGDSLRNEASK